ncbi:hypothetical protein [Terrabacter sp. Ter38]
MRSPLDGSPTVGIIAVLAAVLSEPRSSTEVASPAGRARVAASARIS